MEVSVIANEWASDKLVKEEIRNHPLWGACRVPLCLVFTDPFWDPVGSIPLLVDIVIIRASQMVLMVNNPSANQCRRYKRETGLIPVSGRSPGEGHSNLLQDSCLKNPMDRGAWRDTAHRVSKSWTWMNSLSTASHSHCYYHFTKWGITIWRYYVPCTGRWEEM